MNLYGGDVYIDQLHAENERLRQENAATRARLEAVRARCEANNWMGTARLCGGESDPSKEAR